MKKIIFIFILILFFSCERNIKVIKDKDINVKFYFLTKINNKELNAIGIANLNYNNYIFIRVSDLLFDNIIFDYYADVFGINKIYVYSKNTCYEKNDKIFSNILLNILYNLIYQNDDLIIKNNSIIDYNLENNKIKYIIIEYNNKNIKIEVIKRIENNFPKRIKISYSDDYIILDIIEFLEYKIEYNWGDCNVIKLSDDVSMFEWLGGFYDY